MADQQITMAAVRRRWWHCTCPHSGDRIAAFPENMFHITTCISTSSGKEFRRRDATDWVLEYPEDDAELPAYPELAFQTEVEEEEQFEVTFGELDDLAEEEDANDDDLDSGDD